jgi:hypothetical protein
MERSADKRAATVLKTVETRKLWVRGAAPQRSATFHRA